MSWWLQQHSSFYGGPFFVSGGIAVVSIFSKSGILKVGIGEMKDLYVYKWVPGQNNNFIHFDSANVTPKI